MLLDPFWKLQEASGTPEIKQGIGSLKARVGVLITLANVRGRPDSVTVVLAEMRKSGVE